MTRWIRWSETWTPPGHVGDYLEVKRDDRDGHLRDYRIPAPTPTAYLPCPRPATAPQQPPKETQQVRINVKEYGAYEHEPGSFGVFMRLDFTAKVSKAAMLVNGHTLSHTLVMEPFTSVRLGTTGLPPGDYRLVAEAYDANGRLLDRTGQPRIVTVLPAEPAPQPEPAPNSGGILTTLVSAHGKRLRVWPDGAVDAGGDGDGAWESVEIVEVG